MSLASDTALRSALDQVAAAAGLQVGGALDAAAVGALPGPFVTRELADADGTVVAYVAVADIEGGEELCLALTQAVANGDAGREAEPVATGAGLTARFAGPFHAVGLSDGAVGVAGAAIQAVVLTTVERRAGGPLAPETSPYSRGAVAAGDTPTPGSRSAMGGFDKLVNVALDVSVELGRTRVTLSEVLEYDVGSVVELDRAAGAPVDIRVNGTLLAQGEVVLIDDEYAVRITAIVEPGTLG